MKYKNLEQIAREADVHPTVGMSRRERLERWANVLAQQPERRLCAIEGTEFGTRPERLAKRADGSPITVAFQDRCCALQGCAAIAWVMRSTSSSSQSTPYIPDLLLPPRTYGVGRRRGRTATADGAAGRGSCLASSDNPRRRAVRSGRAWAGGSGALSSSRCGRGCRACSVRDGPAADAVAAGATRCGRATCVEQTLFTA